MSKALAQWAGSKNRQEADRNLARQNDKAPTTPDQEKRALEILQKEAKEHGATLENGGKGGLPSSLVLGAFRKGGYKCEICGTRQNLTIHHRGGIPDTPKANKDGHANKVSNLPVLCAKGPGGEPGCHDKVHEEARAEGFDSSQVTPAGDEGDPRRDHDLPPAEPVHAEDTY